MRTHFGEDLSLRRERGLIYEIRERIDDYMWQNVCISLIWAQHVAVFRAFDVEGGLIKNGKLQRKSSSANAQMRDHYYVMKALCSVLKVV